MRKLSLVVFALGVPTIVGCSKSNSGADAAIAECSVTAGTNLTLDVIVENLARPVFVGAPSGDPRLFVVEEPGRIRIIRDKALVAAPFLDIESLVDFGGERGLLGLAFHPQYATNRRFFVNYTARQTGNTIVAEYQASADDPDQAEPTASTIIEIEQPFGNHNGGMLAFGKDGYLYISTGDGGSRNDPREHGENNTTLLGALLRIDVDSGAPYRIPSSNPYADSANGPDDPRPEIWAYGLRNPWRFSFDRQTGDLYIGDVGQDHVEEIDFQPANSRGGEHYGWDIAEGSRCHEPSTGCDMTGFVPPIAEYTHESRRCSVTGGYVYRGGCMPDLQGRYFYADHCSDQVWTLQHPDNLSPVDQTENLDPNGLLRGVSSFGEDGFGELYIATISGSVFRIAPEASPDE